MVTCIRNLEKSSNPETSSAYHPIVIIESDGGQVLNSIYDEITDLDALVRSMDVLHSTSQLANKLVNQQLVEQEGIVGQKENVQAIS